MVVVRDVAIVGDSIGVLLVDSGGDRDCCRQLSNLEGGHVDSQLNCFVTISEGQNQRSDH